MPDILIRGLSEAAVNHLDATAKGLGVSRVEVLRRQLEAQVPPTAPARSMTGQDWDRFAEAFADLADPQVMAAAWR